MKGDSHTHTGYLSILTNRKTEKYSVAISFLPTSQRERLAVHRPPWEHLITCFWGVSTVCSGHGWQRGWGTFLFSSTTPPPHRWLLTPGLWVWPKRWPSEMAKGYWWPAQRICNCAGPRLRGVISVPLWAAEPPKGKTAEPRTPVRDSWLGLCYLWYPGMATSKTEGGPSVESWWWTYLFLGGSHSTLIIRKSCLGQQCAYYWEPGESSNKSRGPFVKCQWKVAKVTGGKRETRTPSLIWGSHRSTCLTVIYRTGRQGPKGHPSDISTYPISLRA